MEDFWIVVASILLYPLICIACICLPFIAMNVIGFFAKIVDFFKDDPTPPKSTNNPPKNQETSKTTSEKKEPPKQYVRTYPPPKPVQPPQQHKEHVDYLQKYRYKPPSDEKCDSIGNINTHSSPGKPYRKSKAPLIATIVGACLCIVFILVGVLVSVIQKQTPKPPPEHTHEYLNGQCVSCSAYDDFYYWPKYQSILDIMDSMNEPIKDMVTIQSKLKDIPTDYKQAKKITAQCNTLYDLCSTIRNESIKENPDYQKIQTTLFTICEKRDNESYSLWNLSSIINSFFDANLYANTSTVWGLLYGRWECSSGYYISYDGEHVSTNFPHPISHLTSYYLPVHGLEIYVCESSNEWGSNAFRIKSIDKNWILFYCYSNDSTYILTPRSPASGSSGSSSPDISTRYIGNIETKKFHYSWCSYLPDSENRTSLYGRASAISQGYSPCEHCNP